MVKISIIGSGDVAQELFRCLKSFSSEFAINLAFLCHTQLSMNRLSGMVMDSLHDDNRFHVTVSADKSIVAGSDICIICAGVAITREPEANNASINNRNSVFEQNLPIVSEYVRDMMDYCPDALKILVTNPVSRIIHHIVSSYVGIRKIVGCGVTNDTQRVRNELQRIGEINYLNAYIVGEHDICRQSLIYMADNGIEYKVSIDRRYLSKASIQNIKKEHNSYMSSGELPSIDNNLPPMYFSYFKHRLSHFLYKTHISTAECIMEIIRAYIFEDRIVSVETVDAKGTSIIGIPVKFRKGELEYLSFPDELERILDTYKDNYKL